MNDVFDFELDHYCDRNYLMYALFCYLHSKWYDLESPNPPGFNFRMSRLSIRRFSDVK